MFVAAIIATACTLNICARAIQPYGQFEKEPWQAKHFYALDSKTEVTDNWYATDFDDSEWSSINGPICNTDCSNIEYYATPWPNIHSTYWVRRNFTIDSISADKFYTLPLIYDDYCEVYINGELRHMKVYTIEGALIHPNADKETLKRLPRGIYIIDGKKYRIN